MIAVNLIVRITTPWTTVFEEDVGAIISVFMEKVLNKQRFTDIVSRHHRKDSKTVYLETNAVPAIGKNGELTGYRGIDRDVTGRMKVEKALHASNDNLNLLNSITRHDVSNQLTIINGYLDLLGTLVQGEKGPAYLAKARKATLSIRRQIEFSKDYQEMGTRELDSNRSMMWSITPWPGLTWPKSRRRSIWTDWKCSPTPC